MMEEQAGFIQPALRHAVNSISVDPFFIYILGNSSRSDVCRHTHTFFRSLSIYFSLSCVVYGASAISIDFSANS